MCYFYRWVDKSKQPQHGRHWSIWTSSIAKVQIGSAFNKHKMYDFLFVSIRVEIQMKQHQIIEMHRLWIISILGKWWIGLHILIMKRFFLCGKQTRVSIFSKKRPLERDRAKWVGQMKKTSRQITFDKNVAHKFITHTHISTTRPTHKSSETQVRQREADRERTRMVEVEEKNYICINNNKHMKTCICT